ncbi:unnamed protein product [Caenorhabditis bovis]|uniref:BZIP domain-containing protein n=1 Tax=Caenorhabditis bovis TaxID=2654633 RepID=A0A8S1EZG2_9PELO|nr:unnamed protein product [Caenorhabditis bovis]
MQQQHHHHHHNHQNWNAYVHPMHNDIMRIEHSMNAEASFAARFNSPSSSSIPSTSKSYSSDSLDIMYQPQQQPHAQPQSSHVHQHLGAHHPPPTPSMVYPPYQNFYTCYEQMTMGDQEKKKLERKRARNRQAASKCRQKKMDRIKELEDMVNYEKQRAARLDVEYEQLQNALNSLHEIIKKHSGFGCATHGIV